MRHSREKHKITFLENFQILLIFQNILSEAVSWEFNIEFHYEIDDQIFEVLTRIVLPSIERQKLGSIFTITKICHANLSNFN
jgi:hypothetical protein